MISMLLVTVAPALAWEHMGKAWSESDFPLEWYMYPDEEESLAEGESLEALQISWDAWYAAECAAISNEYSGECANEVRDPSDGTITMHWNDAGDDAEVGVLGVTYPVAIGVVVKQTPTMIYNKMIDADIVFNDNVDFAMPEGIDAGCANEYSIVGVATHEIGHLHGMAHSCEQGDPCDDTLKAEATMFWSGGSCSDAQEDINQDDIDGISQLYGPYGTLYATTDRIGGVPLSVSFTIDSDTEVTGATWNFGDGATSEEISPTHEYTAAGQYTVKASMDLLDPVCGTNTYDYDLIGYVLACEQPAPADGADGLFSIEHSSGLTYATTNHTDVSVYGCLDTIGWQVYKGSGEGAIKAENLVDLDGDGEGDTIGAWAPKIEFPEEGDYVVVLNVGGPGGLTAGFLDVTAEDRAAEGSCSTAGDPLTAGAAGLLVAGLAALRRRRA